MFQTCGAETLKPGDPNDVVLPADENRISTNTLQADNRAYCKRSVRYGGRLVWNVLNDKVEILSCIRHSIRRCCLSNGVDEV